MNGLTSPPPPTDPSSNVSNINTTPITSSTSNKNSKKEETHTQNKVSEVATPLLSSETIFAEEKKDKEAYSSMRLNIKAALDKISSLRGSRSNWPANADDAAMVENALKSCCQFNDKGDASHLYDAIIILDHLISSADQIKASNLNEIDYWELITNIGKLHSFLKNYIEDRKTLYEINPHGNDFNEFLVSHKKVLYDIVKRNSILYFSHIIEISPNYNSINPLDTKEKQDFFLHMLTHFQKNYANMNDMNEGIDGIVERSVRSNYLSGNFDFMLKLARIDPRYGEYADESIRGKIMRQLIIAARNDTQG